MRTLACLSTLSFLVLASPAWAQDDGGQPRVVAEVVQSPVQRPAALVPLYVSLAALQAYDGYSTLHGVQSGASEQNPLVGGLASNPAALWTLKAVSTAVPIYFAERLWRDRHPTEAILMMVVANGVIGAVAARNVSFIRR